jgi:chromosome segregation ATPase
MEATIEQLNREVRDLLLPFDPNVPVPPQLTGKSLKEQLLFFQSSMGNIENELQRATSVSSQLQTQLERANSVRNQNSSVQETVVQFETVLTGLWDIIQSGEEDIRRRKQQRRQARNANGNMDDESDMSSDEMLRGTTEPFSLQAFSAKIQSLFAQATSLKDQKKVLQRQIKQQRELNNKSDETKDAQLKQMENELEGAQQSLEKTEREAEKLQTQLMSVMDQLDQSREESIQRGLQKAKQNESESVKLQAVQATLLERNQEIERLEEELQDLKDDQNIGSAELQSRLQEAEERISTLTTEYEKSSKDAEERISSLTAEYKEAGDRINAMHAELHGADELETILARKDAEMENMNMEIARLQTEVTIARAELDGAYGSRAQRAAEVAANPAIQKEIDKLTTSNRTLQKEIDDLRSAQQSSGGEKVVQELKRELSETIEEYELMTKASIEWEKEREVLERDVDKLREQRESLEAKLSDEQVRWLGMKSPGMDGPREAVGAGNTSTTVLKNEFKKMMRDTRAESAKALRVSFLFLFYFVTQQS